MKNLIKKVVMGMFVFALAFGAVGFTGSSAYAVDCLEGCGNIEVTRTWCGVAKAQHARNVLAGDSDSATLQFLMEEHCPESLD